MLRGAMALLAFPAITTWLVLLNLALARLLIWPRPPRPAEYGFVVAGFVASIVTLPFNNQPQILESLIRLYRALSGDARVFGFDTVPSFLHAERAALGAVILAVAGVGAGLAGWCARRPGRRGYGAPRRAPPGA